MRVTTIPRSTIPQEERSMPEILTQYSSEIWSFLGGLFGGGIGGSFLTLRYTRQNRVSGSGSVVDQSRSKAGGDIIGGSKRT
jgi:hypothetical protein